MCLCSIVTEHHLVDTVSAKGKTSALLTRLEILGPGPGSEHDHFVNFRIYQRLLLLYLEVKRSESINSATLWE